MIDPPQLEIVTAVLTVASLGSVLTLLVVLRHLLQGRISSALRSAILAAILLLVTTTAAIPLGLTTDRAVGASP